MVKGLRSSKIQCNAVCLCHDPGFLEIFFLLWQLALSPRDLHGFTENQAVVSPAADAQSCVLRMQSRWHPGIRIEGKKEISNGREQLCMKMIGSS